MRALQLSKTFYRAIFFADSTAHRSLTTLSPSSLSRLLSSPVGHGNYFSRHGNGDTRLLDSPWFYSQRRGVRVNAIHVRPGNVIEKAGRVYRVLDAAHKQQGRGGAMMQEQEKNLWDLGCHVNPSSAKNLSISYLQLELRDVDNGNKLSLRFGTEEPVERVFVEEKSFTCLYTENETAFLIEPDTFEQVEVPLELFGKAAAYLKDAMKVTLQLYDGRPLAASVPKHVTCTIKQAQPPMKGLTSAPRYKKALLDNGLSVQIPSYLEAGEEIVFNTEDDSFVKRANK